MRQEQGRKLVLITLLALAVAAMPAKAQTSGSSIVEEAIKDAQQDQQRDSERVRRMVDEAVKGTEQAPSGRDAVDPPAPETLQPVALEEPGVLPAGYQPEDIKDQPVRDGTGAEIGRVRGMARDNGTGLAKVIVEFQPLFGRPGKVTALGVESLTRAPQQADGYLMDLTPVAYDAMPAYDWADGQWRRAGA